MTGDASERLRRLLSVIPILAGGEAISLEEVQRRAGVDAATLFDDLRAITDRENEPRGFVETVGVEIEHDRVSVRSSHFQRPMRITVNELCALELGLAMLAASTPPDERAPIDRARARLRAAIVNLPAPSREDLWQSRAPEHGDSDIVTRLRMGADRSRKMTITYRGANDVEGSRRIIHPYALAPSHGTWFVVAHCERSEGLRFFRADRVEMAELLDQTFERPTDLHLGELLTKGKPYDGTAPEKLVVRYSARIARWIAEREDATPDADGSLVVEHPLGDLQWGVRHVLQYGPDAEVISPAAVRDEVRRVLMSIAAAVG